MTQPDVPVKSATMTNRKPPKKRQTHNVLETRQAIADRSAK